MIYTYIRLTKVISLKDKENWNLHSIARKYATVEPLKTGRKSSFKFSLINTRV